MAQRRRSSRLMTPKTPRFWPEMKTRRGLTAHRCRTMRKSCLHWIAAARQSVLGAVERLDLALLINA
jgi:hypothetical protein